jgi:hypothetical protein
VISPDSAFAERAVTIDLVPASSPGPGAVPLSGEGHDLELLIDPDRVQAVPAGRPPGSKPGVFQRLSLISAWLPGGSGQDVGFTDLDVRMVLGFPFPTDTKPLLVTPGFGVHYLHGPDTPDLPPRLYDAWIEFRIPRQISPEWAVDFAVAPGIYSDFEVGSSEALRITGRAIGVYTRSPTTQFVVGVLYLDRRDVSVLPAGGIIYTPNDDTRFELVAPKPKIARRYSVTETFALDGDTADPTFPIEWWWYLAGEFGGDQWAIERAGGVVDRLTYRDFRAILGAERKQLGGIYARFEVGYVFGREIEFETATPSFEPSDTVMLRGEISY